MHFRRRGLGLAALVAVVAVLGSAPGGAQAPPPLKVGLILTLTGGAPWTAKVNDATIATFEKLYGDTIAGRKLQFVTRDDTGIAPEVATRVADELILQEHVDVLLGTVLTPNTVAVARVSTAAKKPFFVINSAPSNVLKDNPYSSRYGFTTQQIVPPLATYAEENYGKTAFMIYQNYGPGIDAAKSFSRVFTDAGGTVLGEVNIPVTNQDFAAYIQRARDAKPAVLFIFLNAGGGGAELLKEIQHAGVIKSGIHVVATGDIVDEYITPSITDPPLGLVTTFVYARTHPSALNRRFVGAYHVAAGDAVGPDFTAVEEFDALHALQIVGTALHGDFSDPDKVMGVVKGLKFESPRGPVAIDPVTRDLTQNVYLRHLEMVNGVLENVEFQTFPQVKDPTES